MLLQIKPLPLVVLRSLSKDYVPHVHYGIEIKICIAGRCEVTCNFRTETLHPGDAMVAFSHEIHSSNKTEMGEFITAIVQPSLLDRMESVKQPSRYSNFLLTRDQKLIELALALREEWQLGAEKRSEDILLGYLYVILGRILKSIPLSDNAANALPSRFHEVLTYLSENYKNPMSLNEVSSKFGVSTGHLSRAFSEKLGCSFVQYLHYLRVEHAKTLLRFSDMNILGIAYESGFSDQCTFNRVFKELEGETPKQYRSHCGQRL